MDIYLYSRMRKDELSQQLVQMALRDLAIHGRLFAADGLWSGYDPEMATIHLHNAERLRLIIAEIGWPTFSKVGPEASEAAWLIVQHSIGEAAFMKECYQLMERASGDINPHNLAYLHDRICYFSGRPQRYGTQFQGARLYPIEDHVALNSRRADLQLPPIPVDLIIAASYVEGDTIRQDFHRDPEFNQWRREAGWL
ncbi:DUF6624 domain-containing protein [Dyadobacter jiangsuensis]